MTSRVVAVVNPHSGGGRTGRHWAEVVPLLEAALGPVEARFTDHAAAPHDLPAESLTRDAVKTGANLVIAVGGDGTVNEVVNGFFEAGQAVNPNAELGLLNSGTGGDFRRTFDLPADIPRDVQRLAEGRARTIDLGRITFVADDGAETVRYFDNIASFGMSGLVDRAVNRARVPKLFGGKFTFFWCTLTTATRYTPQAVRITTDAGFDRTLNVGTAAVANGRFFGGGMMIAPNAEPDDGQFDLIIMHDTTLTDLFIGSGALYDGTHLENEKVLAARARSVRAEPVDPDEIVLLDIDGEAPGRLPARFDILPRALKLRC